MADENEIEIDPGVPAPTATDDPAQANAAATGDATTDAGADASASGVNDPAPALAEASGAGQGELDGTSTDTAVRAATNPLVQGVLVGRATGATGLPAPRRAHVGATGGVAASAGQVGQRPPPERRLRASAGQRAGVVVCCPGGPRVHAPPAAHFKHVKVTVTRPRGSPIVISKVFTKANLAN
jgi:hypothetical protein